jgi:2'-5' RNA ligase
VRLFLAVKPDRPAEAKLAQRLLQLQDAIGSMASSLRWTPPSNIHATLHFLGEVAPSRIGGLQDALGTSVSIDPFDVELGGAGVFPPSGAARVIWLDVTKGATEIMAVHAEIGRRLAEAGFAVEARPFSPHLTVARVPDRARATVKALRERLQTAATMPIAWTARWVTLFRSDLSASVPRYEPLHEIALIPRVSSS